MNKNHLRQMADFQKPGLAPVISGINLKGGVGKTLMSCCIGTVGSYAGLRVLIIETCEQKNTLNLMARDRKLLWENTGGIVELMRDQALNPLDYIVESTIDGLHILPARAQMSQYFATSMEKKFPHRWKSAIVALENLRQIYDLIIIDSPPNTEALPMAVLAACTHYFFVSDGDFNSEAGVRKIHERLEEICEQNNLQIECLGILLNNSRNLTRDCENLIRSVGKPPFHYMNFMIPYSRRPITFAATGGQAPWLKNAFAGGRANSPIEEAVYDLTRYIMQKTQLIKGA